ncbi:agmatine/peptidylarginine deiminase [Robiginitalea sp. SC105]|uniref:agmatine deiminase family protein n=1 Tax=Robiginitalea sp. SC105 TaxID=2762332 RepID=UPI001639B363|nr:agmatine deiminase family protein [Robiginitalea sp. SC105]MBC2839728.1 agmatine deiminase family protein [Robiginitalea sp. SC105]
MKEFFSILLISTLIIGCSSTGNSEKQYVYPPEWEPHEAIWADFNFEPYNGVPNERARLELISILSRYVKTKVVYDNDSLMEVGKSSLLELEANFDSLEFIKLPYQSSWMRDPLMFVTNRDQVKILDFEWSCYGIYNCEDDLRGQLSNTLQKLYGYEKDSTGLYFEGGAIEVNSNTIIAYKVLATQRNTDKTIEEVEKILLTRLGKEQIIWLDRFPLIDKPMLKIDRFVGQGANGHIDVTTRFLNDTTILATVISEDDRDKNALLAHDYDVFQENLIQLKKARQPNGKPYHIETIEAPDYSLHGFPWVMNEPLYYGLFNQEEREKISLGDSIIMVPALEYANFTITNGVVIASKYWKEGMPDSEKTKDKKLRTILERYFPNRDIIMMDALSINWGGGGIHCRTQQEPKLN